MIKKDSWFYIEPYVHISLKERGTLLYNTLTGDALEYNRNKRITGIVKKLKSKKNLLVVKLSTKDFKDVEISKFVVDIREKYMGDLISVSSSNKKPIELMAMLNIQSDAKRIKKDPGRSVGENIMQYLNRCVFYINSECLQNCSMCKDAHKQFLFCTSKGNNKTEINVKSIEKLIKEAKGSSLARIDIAGGNIFSHSEFKEIATLLNKLSMTKAYYVHYLNVPENDYCLKLLSDESNEVNILVNYPVQKDKLLKAVKLLQKNNINAKYVFAIEKEKDVNDAESIITQLKTDNFLFQPYFSGKNLGFFKKHVFMDKKEILESKPQLKDIFTYLAINALNFGRITILNNGDIHANINTSKIGTLGKDSLHDVVLREMCHGKNWQRVRTEVRPCKKCTFEALCPPLSNYEYALKRNNLCNIWKEKKS